MKCPGFYLTLLCLSILSSCSNDTADQQNSTTNTSSTASTSANISPAETASVAKKKIPDAAVQGMSGKIKEMSETISFPGNPKRLSSKNVFKYNEKGNRIELSNFKTDGTLNSRIKSTYDANGIITGEQTFLADGKVDVNSEIKTDSIGNIIEQNDTRPAADRLLPNHRYSFKYDEKGQQIERTAYKGNGIFSFKYQFKYDENGNRIEWIQYGQSHTIIGKVYYKYDEKNNLTEEKHYDGAGTLKATYVVVREFDKKNNWIRQEKLQNNTVKEVRERQIKYY